MPSNKKAEIVITCNSAQPKAAVRAMKVELDKLTKSYEQLNNAGKAGTAKAKNMLQDIKDLRAAIKNTEADMTKVSKVTQNLADSSLRQLKLALAQVKKEMSSTSENSKRLDSLRQKYKAINDQIKVLEGTYVNIGKHINDLSSRTDSWLSKAISQQKTHIASIDKQNHEYQTQVGILQKLEAEEAKRAAAKSMTSINTNYSNAIRAFNAPGGIGAMSAQQLRDARSALVAKRDTLDPSTHATEIENINKLLKETELELDRIAGKEKEIEPTVQKVARDVFNLTKNLNDATPEQLRKGLEACRAQLDKMGSGDARRKAWVKWANELEAALKGVDREVVDVDKVLRNIKATPLDQLKQAAKQLEQEMAKMPRDIDAYSKKEAKLVRIRGEIDNTTNAIRKQSSAWQTTFRNISMYFGVFQLFSLAQQKLTQMLRANYEYSDQLADIRKVTGLTTDAVNDLSTAISKIDTRTSLQGLADLAYQGGKMGFGKYGVEGMTEFVRAADQVKVALSDDLGDDSLLQISKLVDTMGLIPKLGVERSMLAVGSSINQLSATSTASGTHIVDFAKRLTGLSRITGISTSELLALGSAADALGQAPEVAATAFGKLFTSLQTNHNLIEQQLGMEKGIINAYFQRGEAMEAILQIMEKMRDKGNMNALGNIWKDLGSEGQRLIGVMATMSKNVDTVRAHVEESNTAFEEATSLTNEYMLKQETANAILERANNIWAKAFVNPDGVDMVKEFAQAWYDVSESMTSSTVTMTHIRTSLSILAVAAEVLVRLLPMLVKLMLFTGVVAAIRKVWLGFVQMQGAVNAATGAVAKFNAALKANMFALVAGVILTLGSYFVDLALATREAADAQDDLRQAEQDALKDSAKQRAELKRLYDATQDVTKAETDRLKACDDLRKAYPGYFDDLTNEQILAGKAANAYKKLTEQIIASAKARAIEKKIEQLQEENVNLEDENEERKNWNKEHEEQYKVEQRKADAAVGQQNRAEVAGVGGSKMGYVHASNKADKALIGQYQGNVRQVTTNDNKIKSNNERIQRLANQAMKVQPESPGTLDNQQPDPNANKEQAALEEQMRDRLKQAQNEAKAVIDNIKNYYQRQITEVLKTANEKNWDTTLTEANIRVLESRMNLALSQARKGIAGVNNTWDEFKKSMDNDMLEKADEVGYNESQQLLNAIQETNIAALRKKIATLSKSLNMPETAATDAIWKNATLNEKANETIEEKRRKEYQQRLLERNYTGQVDKEYTNSMETMGFFDITEAQHSTIMGSDEAAAKALIDRRTKEIEQLMKNAREHIVDLYAITDAGSDEGRNRLMEILFGKNWDQDESELKKVFDLMGEDVRLFYDELLKYSDAYTEAQKKAHDKQKKVLDFQWGNSSEFHEIEDKQKYNEMQTSQVGQYSADIQKRKANGEDVPRNDIYGTTSFINSMGNDPEVESYRLKMEAADAYYKFLAAHQADAETMRDAEMSVLKSEMEYAKSVAQQMKQRIDDVYALASPIEDFGTSMGKAFATMTEDAEAGRKAIRAAIGDMINGFMEQTVKMTEEWIKRRIMQQMNDKLTSTAMKEAAAEQVALEEKKQDDITDAQKEGGEAKQSIFKKIGNGFMSLFKKQKKDEVKMEEDKQNEIIETQETGGEAQEFLNQEVKGNISKATAEIGNETLQTEQAQVQQEVQTESAKTQANTSMGIASGASKIIGTLGWWGIPLIAVITALLNGLLSFAMSKVSSLFGGGSESDDGGGQTAKLVTGMLTYDSGNVQAYAGVLDGKSYPVVGSDGNVYAATDGGELSTGLVKDPITTFVNGQPALVAEKGPEMVIGRETTAAMMMARPDLMAEIVKFDKNRSGVNYRVFDEGNVGEFGAFANPDGSPAAPSLSHEDVQQLRGAITEFTAMMLLLQKNGLHVNKYGRGGIAEEAEDGAQFMGRYSGSRLWNKKK